MELLSVRTIVKVGGTTRGSSVSSTVGDLEVMLWQVCPWPNRLGAMIHYP